MTTYYTSALTEDTRMTDRRVTFSVLLLMSSMFATAVNICSVQPSATVVFVDEKVSLNCAANGDYSIQSWQLGIDVQNRTLIYLEQEFGPNGTVKRNKFEADGYSVSNAADNNISLHIHQIKFSQAGLYACQCNDPTRSIAKSAVAVLAKEPTFSISSTIAHGMPVSFTCNISFSGSTGISSKLMINDTSGNTVNRTNCSSSNVPTSCILMHTITANVSVDQSHTCSVQLMSNNTTIYSKVFNRTLLWQRITMAEIVVSNPQKCSSKKCVVGESITCKTDGNPETTVFHWWQSRINSSALPIGDGSKFLALNDIGQFTYQCQAYSVIQHVTYNATSNKFTISVTADDSKPPGLSMTFVVGISVAIGIIVIIIAIVVSRILCSRNQKKRTFRTLSTEESSVVPQRQPKNAYNTTKLNTPVQQGHALTTSSQPAASNNDKTSIGAEVVLFDNDLYVGASCLSPVSAVPSAGCIPEEAIYNEIAPTSSGLKDRPTVH